jgi:hypothetical protein
MRILHQKYLNLFFIGIFALFFLVGCTSKNRLDIDVPNTEISIQYQRLDQLLFNIKRSEDDVVKQHFILLDSFPETYQLFVEVMLREGNVYDTATAKNMLNFLSDNNMRYVFDAVSETFPEPQFFKDDFTKAFKYYKHYFPEAFVPNIMGYFSNFNAKTLILDSSIAIGLELYLGKEHPVIQSLSPQNIPAYLKKKMDKDYLVSDALKFFLLSNHYVDMGDDFLSTIVSMGKILYLLDAIQPQVEDWKKMGYSEAEMKWCKKYEDQIWKYIVEQQLLFSVSKDKISHFIDEGPFTKGLPEESPSMVGIWLGWQMVRDYMNENKDVSLQDLINETDSKKILKYYQPD